MFFNGSSDVGSMPAMDRLLPSKVAGEYGLLDAWETPRSSKRLPIEREYMGIWMPQTLR